MINELELDGSVTSASFEGSTTRGLWAALVDTIPPCSAAGSKLAGPSRPGQPISIAGMFDYDTVDTDPPVDMASDARPAAS